MAAQLPVVFRSGGGSNTFNFDWFDYLAGTAFKRFYLCGLETSGGTKTYIITDRVIYADRDNVTVTANNNTVEYDFDLTFNNPATLQGTAIINFSQVAAANTSVNVT